MCGEGRPAGLQTCRLTGRRGRPLPPGAGGSAAAAVHSQRKVGQPAPSPHRPVPVTLPFALSFSHTGHFLVSRKCEASPPTSRPPPRSPPPPSLARFWFPRHFLREPAPERGLGPPPPTVPGPLTGSGPCLLSVCRDDPECRGENPCPSLPLDQTLPRAGGRWWPSA